MWPCIVMCDRSSWHVTVHRDMWSCIVTRDRASWHVAVHRDVWPCVVTCDRASWHVTVHRDMWPASWHVTVHRNMWPCIVTCDCASWHVTVRRDMWPCIVTNFFIIKPTGCTNFTNLFWHETLHVSETSSVHHQEFIHCTLSNGTSWSCSTALYKPVWHTPLLSVQWINSWWWTEEVSETCRVSCQNKFVKLVRPVGFIIKKYRDASNFRRLI